MCFLVTTSVVSIALILGSSFAVAQHCAGPRDHQIRPKVVGGWPAKLKHWPGQVTLRFHNSETRESSYFCGGVSVAPKWVLTAAHCFEHTDDGKKSGYFEVDEKGGFLTDVRAWGLHLEPTRFSGKGRLQVVHGTDDLEAVGKANVSDVAQIIIHPDYKSPTSSGHDMALVQLQDSVPGPLARLSADRRSDPPAPPGATSMVAGFGDQRWRNPVQLFKTRSGGRFAAGSRQLREVDLPMVATATCQARFPKSRIGDNQLCAGHDEGRKDSCQGDSGGPLVSFDRNNCPFVTGIVSWGARCAEPKSYGIYSRVSSYIPWIRQYVPEVATIDASDVPVYTDKVRLQRDVDAQIAELERTLGGAVGRVSVQIRRRDGGGEVSAQSIAVDERFVFDIDSSVSGHVIVVDVNADGVVTQIFPNKLEKGTSAGQIISGTPLVLPGKGYGFDWFRAAPPLGEGKLIVIVAPRNFATRYATADKERFSKGFVPEVAPVSYLANLIDQIAGLVGIRGGGEATQRASWAMAVQTYRITE